jgi:hypothetical protein
VLTAEVMSTFDLYPADVILSLYRLLIGAYAAEQAQLVRRAIELVQPLVSRCAPTEASDAPGATPEWLNVVVEVTADAQCPQTHVQHVWSVITQHSGVFFTYRHVISDWLVHSISRALSAVNAQADVKKLLIEVVEVLVAWDIQAGAMKRAAAFGAQQAAVAPPNVAVAGLEAAAPAAAGEIYELPVKLQEAVTNVLLLSTISTTDVQGSTLSVSELSPRCFAALEKIGTAELWPLVSINIIRVDKVLAQCPPDIAATHPFRSYVNCLKLVTLVLRRLNRESSLLQVGQVQNGMIRASLCKHNDVSEAFRETITTLLTVQPQSQTPTTVRQPQSAEVARLYKFCLQYWVKSLTDQDKTGNAGLCHILKLFQVFHSSNLAVLDET